MARIGPPGDPRLARSARGRILQIAQYSLAAGDQDRGVQPDENYWLSSAFVLACMVGMTVFGRKLALPGW
jgi:hypothetical protein